MKPVLRYRIGLGVLLVATPAAKAAQVVWWEGRDFERQLGLLAGGGLIFLAVATSRRMEGLITAQIVAPRPSSRSDWLDVPRLARFAVGAAAVGACVASVVAHVHDDRRATIGFAAVALFPLALLVLWELERHQNHRAVAPLNRPGPDRAVLWVVAPAVLLWVIVIAQAAIRRQAFDGDLGCHDLILDLGVASLEVTGLAGSALFTALVIGLGEELLFRGLLLTLAVRARLETVGSVLVSLAFGAWHIPDAWSDGAVAVVATVLAMTVVSQVVFIPLRLRSRSIAGPALLHASNNLVLRLV